MEEVDNISEEYYIHTEGNETDAEYDEEFEYRYDEEIFENEDEDVTSKSEKSWHEAVDYRGVPPATTFLKVIDSQLMSLEETKDWEKEAKKTVKIEIDETPSERRLTIYELPSYDTSSGPSVQDILKLGVPETDVPEKKVRYSVSMGIPGLARIELSALTQKIIGCVIGEDVTAEYPWVYVKKEIIEDNIDLHSESSDFLAIKDEIQSYPDKKMLIGYAPSTTADEQFYICLTEAGRDAIVQHIQNQRQEHENRVRTAIYKPCSGKWRDLGSEKEVDEALAKNTRPLLQIEVEAPSNILNAPLNLVDRQADDQEDGYVELLPYRQVFNNVQRPRIDSGDQITPNMRENEAQTTTSMMVDNWFQYQYEYTPIDVSQFNEQQTQNFVNFLERNTDRMCDQVLWNATWDDYADYFAKLVLDERDTRPPIPMEYTEQQNYHDSKFVADKVINDLCWHPLWSGIAVACYTDYAKSEHIIGRKPFDEVLKASKGDNKALLWSFTDCLSPKLILECSREVTAVSFCPLDGNVIIGGCTNGQIAIWDITGKLEQVEAVAVQTIAQAEYRRTMKKLMSWMQEPADASVVHPAAMTSLQHSQKCAITQIMWMPTHQKINKNGRIESLPDDATSEDLNWQFATSSEDGTIAFWDLRWRPPEKMEQHGTRKRKKRMPQPEALTQAISKYKVLDNSLTPDYILVLQYPDSSYSPVITALSMYSPECRKEEIPPHLVSRDDITVRRYYRPVIEKPDYAMEAKIFVGTVKGDVGCITWEGYEFSTGAVVNREQCQWQWIKSIHDGPVTQAVRSKYHNNIVMTVGGQIFAVWRDDYSEPIFWKKSAFRYTACAWGTFRPTVLILTRVDGNVEIWDLVVKTHEPSFTQSLSGRIITGIYPHILEPQCLGFCDFNGTLRIFTAPRVLLTYDVADIEWMQKFADRQVNRMKEFHQWQNTWRKANIKVIEARKKLAEAEAEKKRIETGEKVRIKTVKIEDEIDGAKKPTRTRKAWEFLEEAKARWLAIEEQRMQRVILEKKGLRKDDLEEQLAPVLKLQQEAERKKRKIRKVLQLQDEIFRESVAYLFPERRDERKPSLTFLPALSEKHRPDVEFTTEDEVPVKEVPPKSQFDDPQEEIIYNFMEVQAEALAALRVRRFKHSFNWRKVLSEGLLRRQPTDPSLKRRSTKRMKHNKFVGVARDADFTIRGDTLDDT